MFTQHTSQGDGYRSDRISHSSCLRGSERKEPVALAPAGTLHTLATVHLHAGKDSQAPFTVAEVALDAGPLIRALLAEPAEREAIGRRVHAEWAVVRTDDEGNEVVEPRFAFAREEGAS